MRNSLYLALLLLARTSSAEVKIVDTAVGQAPLGGSAGAVAGSAKDLQLSAPSAPAPLGASLITPSGAPRVQPAPDGADTPARPAQLPAAPADVAGKAASAPFLDALARLGAPQKTIDALDSLLKASHPGRPEAVYHGLRHSQDVPNLMAAVLDRVPAEKMSRRRRMILIVAAALHDVDPIDRVPETPARVWATLKFLDASPQAQAIFTELDLPAAQIKALIRDTDFSPDPAGAAQIERQFQADVAAAFPEAGDRQWALLWGPVLRLIDRSVTYTGTVESALLQVKNLAHELRSAAKAAGKPFAHPTDDEMIAGSYAFLSALRQDPNFHYLPQESRKKFDAVLAFFAARAPPALVLGDKAERYISGIMGSRKPTEAETTALLEDFLETQGLKADSEIGRALKERLTPAQAGSEKSIGEAFPDLKPFSDVVLSVSRDYNVPPLEIQLILKRAGALSLLGGLSKAAVRRLIAQLLERRAIAAAVSEYPLNEQGRFLRAAATDISAPSGKSIEEISRDGVFAYANFNGRALQNVAVSRDPDGKHASLVYYVQFIEGKWKIGVYRQNARPGFRGGPDADFVSALKAWLVAGGIPAKDLL